MSYCAIPFFLTSAVKLENMSYALTANSTAHTKIYEHKIISGIHTGIAVVVIWKYHITLEENFSKYFFVGRRAAFPRPLFEDTNFMSSNAATRDSHCARVSSLLYCWGFALWPSFPIYIFFEDPGCYIAYPLAYHCPNHLQQCLVRQDSCHMATMVVGASITCHTSKFSAALVVEPSQSSSQIFSCYLSGNHRSGRDQKTIPQ